MAKYVMQEMPKLNERAEGIKYPKMKLIGQCSHKDIVSDIVERTSFTRGDVEGLIVALSEAIASRVAYGYSVKVDGLGSFKAKLGLRPGIEREGEDGSQRNATSIEIARLNYVADKEIIRRCNALCRLERQRAEHYTPPQSGQTERLDLLKQHLQQHKFIKIAMYAQLTGLSHSSAGKELRSFYAEGHLGIIGAGTHRMYILPTKD